MQTGDRVDVDLNTGKTVGSGTIITVIDDVPPDIAAVRPTVSVAVQLRQGQLSTFGVPRHWLKETGPHRWKIDLPDRGQFSLSDDVDRE